MSEHIGPPKWNGVEKDFELKGCLFAYDEQLGPILVLIENCNDFFCPIFSTEEKLRDHMKHIRNMGLLQTLKKPYKIKEINESQKFMESLCKAGVRIMHNPQIISDHHTKWNEIIYDGEQWKIKIMNEEIRTRFYWEKQKDKYVVVDSTGKIKSDTTMTFSLKSEAEKLVVRLNSSPNILLD